MHWSLARKGARVAETPKSVRVEFEVIVVRQRDRPVRTHAGCPHGCEHLHPDDVMSRTTLTADVPVTFAAAEPFYSQLDYPERHTGWVE